MIASLRGHKQRKGINVIKNGLVIFFDYKCPQRLAIMLNFLNKYLKRSLSSTAHVNSLAEFSFFYWSHSLHNDILFSLFFTYTKLKETPFSLVVRLFKITMKY